MKDKRIIEETQNTDEPIFVFRAKDEFAIDVLEFYLGTCIINNCTSTHVTDIKKRIVDFKLWRNTNSHKVKKPD